MRKLVMVFTVLVLSSCSPGWLNPDSYGQKHFNEFIFFNMDNHSEYWLDDHMIDNAVMDPSTATVMENGVLYTITMRQKVDRIYIKIFSDEGGMDFMYFDGYDYDKNEELEWRRYDDGKRFEVDFHVDKLLPPNHHPNNFYGFMVTRTTYM
jgi:hypothetical protein